MELQQLHFDNDINKLFCHSEQSEESGILRQILRFAQNDKKQISNVVIKLIRTKT
jgi:hypothetical protein